ncbi:restriction endonuclease subunit S [Shewanella schlegeliana]|uniref:Restriction endonuclease subunit S n=1 Tax=Shewanella schlegeliana TaxID=190308 RepID=A0ABS1SXT4_9GAMM|nr:restriction endonuclease subunit S [Shewanella schlegeliana]MBL4912815.1 restriction endonuclease subunit S [Shewanella schlegeliana]MCL1109087.1 restriction endonuclease subunit S [Shewanella schlegeliana]GIU23065.1 restriction modification system DNA specificity domain-containing protein [Shewanella schlegeliana]
MGKQHEYSEYQSTGIAWCGKVPAHWSLVPCRAAVDHIVEKNHDGKVQNYLSVMANVGVIPYEEKGDIGNKKPDDLSKCKLVRKGQLVINSMNYSIGSYGMSDYDGVCSPVYIILQANTDTLHKRFALRVFENTPFQKHLATFGNGILAHRAAIGWDDIKGQYIPVPPMEEQEKILHFLDHETAKIDTLIEKQQQLIKLLKEKRQAVNSHVVTKGLNSQAPMKDSGVEWLGEVPEHWESIRVKQVSTFITSGPRGWSDYITDDGQEIFLQSGDLNNQMGLQLEKAKRVSPPSGVEGVRTKLSQGDVVVCITGANTGRVAVVDELSVTTYINQHLSLIRCQPLLVNPRFLTYSLSSKVGRSYFDVVQYGLKEGLSLSNICEAPFALPPMSEQNIIVKHLDTVCAKFDVLTQKAMQQVELLKERRTSLISAAVTGKIDVRNWQAPTSQNQAMEQTA